TGRDERSLTVVAGAMAAIDTALDALVEEALAPFDPDRDAVTGARALTDLSAWRSLRELGLSDERCAEAAAASVLAWVEPRAPARLSTRASPPAAERR